MKRNKGHILTTRQSHPKSLIATISAGYEVLYRRLWVLIIPIAVDLFFWLGTPLSFAPFFQLIRDRITGAARLLAFSPTERELLVVQLQQADMRSAAIGLNLLPLFIPQPASQSYTTAMVVGSPPLVLLFIVLINLIALMVSAVYLVGLATGVRRERLTVALFGRRLVAAVLRTGGYILLLLLVASLVGLPFLLLAAAMAQLLPDLVPWLALLWFAIIFWLYLYTGFAIEVVLVGGKGLLRSLLTSISIVRHSFFNALGLVLLSFGISVGMGVLWSGLATTLSGWLVALAGSAAIGSGLVAARQVFVYDRLTSLHQEHLR